MKTCDYCKKDTSEPVRQHLLRFTPQFDDRDGGHDFSSIMDLHDGCCKVVSTKTNKLLEGLGLPQGVIRRIKMTR